MLKLEIYEKIKATPEQKKPVPKKKNNHSNNNHTNP